MPRNRPQQRKDRQVKKRYTGAGFTLLELSIVLVIIGLIVGGVLVGRDLIGAAEIRAQISQIEKYQTAVNTFKLKYNNQLPGDISDPDATAFGLSPRGNSRGTGDGNGILEGFPVSGGYTSFGWVEGTGETLLFWIDLTTSGLIDGRFNFTGITLYGGGGTVTSNFDAFFPRAKIGNGNYIYVWSGGIASRDSSDGKNYFGLSGISSIYNYWSMSTHTALSVAQAQIMPRR